jgi:hypothetical protein
LGIFPGENGDFADIFPNRNGHVDQTPFLSSPEKMGQKSPEI